MKKRVMCLIVLALLCVSCAGSAPNILNVQVGPMGIRNQNVEVNDKFLKRNLSFGDVSLRPLGQGNDFEAQVMLKNESKRDLSFEYRFMWYDAEGYELSSLTAWIPVRLGAKEPKGFRSPSPGPNAASFKFMVRKPHPLTDSGSGS